MRLSLASVAVTLLQVPSILFIRWYFLNLIVIKIHNKDRANIEHVSFDAVRGVVALVSPLAIETIREAQGSLGQHGDSRGTSGSTVSCTSFLFNIHSEVTQQGFSFYRSQWRLHHRAGGANGTFWGPTNRSR